MIEERKVKAEVELDGVRCVKNAYIPAYIPAKGELAMTLQAISGYFKSVGYEKVTYVKILTH